MKGKIGRGGFDWVRFDLGSQHSTVHYPLFDKGLRFLARRVRFVFPECAKALREEQATSDADGKACRYYCSCGHDVACAAPTIRGPSDVPHLS